MKLSIVIVNYNVRSYLEQCLYSIEKSMSGISGEVIVVDNNSTDDSVEYLRPKFPWVNYVENKYNAGFSRANNQAIKMARGEYVLLLNPDTFIGEDTIGKCLEFMDANPQAGMCGVRMLRLDGSFAPESRRGVPTPFTAFSKMSGLCSLFPKSRVFGRYYMQYLDNKEVNEIDIVSGAFMFIRKSILSDIGLLDETFFMYGEDIDISYRSLLAGYKNYYIPTSILHYKGESTKKSSVAYVNVFHKAMIIFFRKHFSRNNILLELLMSCAIGVKACGTFLRNKLKAFREARMKPKQPYFLLVSDGFNLEQMKEVSEKNGIRYDVLPSGNGVMPPKSILDKEYDYIVFDTDRYSYQSVLEFFRHDGEYRDQSCIATYQSYSKSIIVAHGAIY